jgi:exodeoxyribonuclease VII large subunit
MIRILERRHKNLHLLLYPVRVQGAGSADEIAEAIRFFNQAARRGSAVDVLIVARGGGSLEDLWAFNEENLARAIASSQIPIISAVGHETDFTICDFVADLRAPTPSAAAELVIETQEQIEQQIAAAEEAMKREMRYLLLHHRQQLTEWSAHRSFQNLRGVLAQLAQRNDELAVRLQENLRTVVEAPRRRWEASQAFLQHLDLRGRLQRADLNWRNLRAALDRSAESFLSTRGNQIELLEAKLHNHSPRRVLERGYAIVFDESGKVLRSAGQTSSGQLVRAQLAEGSLHARVEQINADENDQQ